MEIFEEGRIAGTFEGQPEGLFLKAVCVMQDCSKVRRIYLAHKTGSLYVGIPDHTGRLTASIPQKYVPEKFCCVASAAPRGKWSPWRGELDGVQVETALIQEGKIALPPEEAENFPAWTMKTFDLSGKEMALVPLNGDGMPVLAELTKGDTENEENSFGDSDSGMPSDLPSADSGSSDGGQADCADL